MLYWADIIVRSNGKERRKDGKKEWMNEMFYLTTHSTHFIYGYVASDIWLRTIMIARKETHCRYMGYSFRLAARVILYAPSHIQDSTYHSLCCTSRGALNGMRNSSVGPPWRIDPTIQHTMSGSSTMELHLVHPSGKKINVLFNDALNTFHFMVIWHQEITY